MMKEYMLIDANDNCYFVEAERLAEAIDMLYDVIGPDGEIVDWDIVRF